MRITLRHYFIAIVYIITAAIFLLSCKTIETVRCKATSMRPVVVIGANGVPYTIMVPFCDTLQVVPKVPDSLQVQ